MIFFGFGGFRMLLVFFGLFLVLPLLAYSPGLALIIALFVGAAALGSGALGRRTVERGEPQRALEPERPFTEVRSAAQDDLLALADGIRELDIDVEMPGASQAAKDEYARALDAYERARAAFDRARHPEDFEAVSTAVEEGRYAIVATKARLEGREPPARRPPCFFDPRHGPSVRDVEWAPPGGVPRPVPACAADAIRIEEGYEPMAREVWTGGRSVPYWEAPAYYGGWAGGFFSGFGGVLPALLVGSVLGAGLTALDPFGEGDYGESDLGGDFVGGDFGGLGE